MEEPYTTRWVTYANTCTIEITYDEIFNRTEASSLFRQLRSAVNGAHIHPFCALPVRNKDDEARELYDDPNYEPTEHDMEIDELDAYRDDCSPEDEDPRNDESTKVSTISDFNALAVSHMGAILRCEAANREIMRGGPWALDSAVQEVKKASKIARRCYDAIISLVCARKKSIFEAASVHEAMYINVMRRTTATLDSSFANLNALVGPHATQDSMQDCFNRLLPIVVEDIESAHYSLVELSEQNFVIASRLKNGGSGKKSPSQSAA